MCNSATVRHWVKTRQPSITATGFQVPGTYKCRAPGTGQTANIVDSGWYALAFGSSFSQTTRFR
jgi:hypothetical protein